MLTVRTYIKKDPGIGLFHILPWRSVLRPLNPIRIRMSLNTVDPSFCWAASTPRCFSGPPLQCFSGPNQLGKYKYYLSGSLPRKYLLIHIPFLSDQKQLIIFKRVRAKILTFWLLYEDTLLLLNAISQDGKKERTTINLTHI